MTMVNGYQQSDREGELHFFNVDDLRQQTEEILPRGGFAYIEAGAEEEWTLNENTRAFYDYGIISHVMTGKSDPDLHTTFLGQTVNTPILLPPLAAHGLANSGAEVSTARGAAMAGAVMGFSTYGNSDFSEIAAENKGFPQVFGLYLNKDWDLNKRMLEEAHENGMSAIMLTADATVGGYRERDMRAGFSYPIPMKILEKYSQDGSGKTVFDLYNQAAQVITPEDIQRLSEMADLPVIVKGVMSSEDAEIAIQAGAKGIYVSNHGGRQVDGAPAPITVLPEIAQTVNHRVPIIMDSGVRRGSHVFKALALGADFVGIGRPFMYGLANGGAEGVREVIEYFNKELTIDMQLTGATTIEDIKKSELRRLH